MGFSPQREMRPFPTAASREKSHVPSWASKRYSTPFMQLKKFPDIPHSRGTLIIWAQLNLSPFAPPHLEMRVDSPASSGKEGQRPCRPSRGGWSQLETREEHGSLATIQKTRISPSTWDKTWFPCTDSNGTLSINSQHERRTDTLVANLRKAPGPQFNSTGGLKPLLQLERKAEFYASTQVETWLPVWNCRHTPRFMSKQERKPEVSASTRDEALFYCTHPRGIPRGPS